MTVTEQLLLPTVVEAVCLIMLVIISRKTGWIKEPSGDAIIAIGCVIALLGIIYTLVIGFLHGKEHISYSTISGVAIAFGVSIVGYTGGSIIGILRDPTLRKDNAD